MTDRPADIGPRRLPPSPLIYEINTWVWLAELSDRIGCTGASEPITLADVPDATWDAIAESGFDAVWLMGVWRRSAAGARIARGDRALMESFAEAVGDLQSQDVVGSPYAVRDYTVDDHLGGPAGLVAARRALADRGVALILDYVPNHVALDHPWVGTHPTWFIGGDRADLAADDASFTEIDGRVIAHGRDPYFPAWTDVAQLNAFDPDLRAATDAELSRIATQCDGVRCDMAMLVMNEVFAWTWGNRAGPVPTDDFWPDIIASVRARHPGFVFIAEAYWGTECALIDQGFDHCYDKTLYDTLRDEPGTLAHRPNADDGDPHTGVRFIENHDEPRAPEAFGERDRQAAVVILTVPGARLIHHGQLTGRRRRLPVQLGRSPDEPVDGDRAVFYRALLGVVDDDAFRSGGQRWCDTRSAPALLAWTRGARRWLIVVNTAGTATAGRIRPDWSDPDSDPDEAHPAGQPAPGTRLVDALSGQPLHICGDGAVDVRLGPWGWLVLRLIDTDTDRADVGWVP
ncbi:alpha-amylase family glycosyl hydrolase [Gordonia sp. NPDC062954]|uniref:Alpha-amylase family glycosyl hydrolase n=1 Tax=Gordonia aquimaris TaxID=2984863 RepID=A0A9X3D3G9_9ACTN|nr:MULTISPECIES: alpha-amylase family glycosyl hydrolase [Gordonia]MCX2964368.1 alpha-amylase family glycosyl hydrolase [Gordonia aquimaris]